jgi:hypothetical protein
MVEVLGVDLAIVKHLAIVSGCSPGFGFTMIGSVAGVQKPLHVEDR